MAIDLHPEITNLFCRILTETNSLFPFLLVGATSSGKSTLLDQFMKMYYNGSPAPADIWHVHAFSELTLSEYVGQLKQFCPFRCSVAGRKRLVVLDDADTLPEAMQQIMCSIMDKYKQQVLFIAACSSPRKLVESFQSRFLMLQMKPLDEAVCAKFFRHLTTTMRIEVAEEAAAFLLQIVGANLKRMVRCVEKMRLYREDGEDGEEGAAIISLEAAAALCTHIPHSVFEQFLAHTAVGDWMAAANLWYDWHDKGHSTIDLFVAFFEYVKLAPSPLPSTEQVEMAEDEQKYKCIALLSKRMAAFYENEDKLHIAHFAFDLARVWHRPIQDALFSKSSI